MNAARSPQPEDVLGFWFSSHAMARWFSNDEAFDAEIENLFEPLFEGAIKGGLDYWAATPEGALALVILLDQFPRNLFRGQPRAFAFDERAREISDRAIANGFDLDSPRERRLFFYLPFMHSEDLEDQRRSMQLIEERLGEPAALRAARDHFAVIERFGRFPQRNAILAREATAEESAFLAGRS